MSSVALYEIADMRDILGLCACGCGNPVPVRKRTESRYGHIAGQPSGMLKGHKRGGIHNLADVFAASSPEPNTGCWLWTRSVNGRGYGSCQFMGAPRLAHRVSWVLSGRGEPGSLCVLHRCDTPACVNPDHLFLGTVLDNNADRVRKNRSSGGRNGPRRIVR